MAKHYSYFTVTNKKIKSIMEAIKLLKSQGKMGWTLFFGCVVFFFFYHEFKLIQNATFGCIEIIACIL